MTRALVVALVVLATSVVADVAGRGVPTATAEPTGSTGSCARPYSARSPWNRPIGGAPQYDPGSEARLGSLRGTLISDTRGHTFPVYEVTSRTPRQAVDLSGWFSDTSAGGKRLRNVRGALVEVPIPARAQPAAGSDGQIVVVNRSTGEEWGFWRARRSANGSWSARNGYRYNVRWSGVPPTSRSSFTARGSGIPYLAGLVRRCEVARGRIDHALAFAYDYPAGSFVHPATKSDGMGSSDTDLPEGARLQLDPTLTRAEIEAWGCRRACLTIARALQTYGMYVVDNSAREKIMVEYRVTARWNGLLTTRTVSPIPLDAFKLLRLGRVRTS